MRKLATLAVLAGALALSGCGMTIEERVQLLEACTKAGGAYTEGFAAGGGRMGECNTNETGEDR